jgi:hypothetical protein
MKEPEKELFTERAAKALEGIEMLLAMWIEKTVPGAELWVSENPDTELAGRAWRESKPTAKFLESPGIEQRLHHVEERLNRLASELAVLEARVHEEQPD